MRSDTERRRDRQMERRYDELGPVATRSNIAVKGGFQVIFRCWQRPTPRQGPARWGEGAGVTRNAPTMYRIIDTLVIHQIVKRLCFSRIFQSWSLKRKGDSAKQTGLLPLVCLFHIQGLFLFESSWPPFAFFESTQRYPARPGTQVDKTGDLGGKRTISPTGEVDTLSSLCRQ